MKLYTILIVALSAQIVFGQETEPDNRLGKTHFIVQGTQITKRPEKPAIPQKKITKNNDLSTCVFFTPDDNVRQELITIIDAEKEAIYSAVFMVTDKAIAHALARAQQRGVHVELIVDVGCLKDKASKIPLLSAQGCTVYLYDPTLSDAKTGNSLMHHKFALFKNNNGSHLVWTGSYNFTKAASEHNHENVIVIKKDRIYNRYFHQFEQLRNKSYKYERKTIIKERF